MSIDIPLVIKRIYLITPSLFLWACSSNINSTANSIDNVSDISAQPQVLTVTSDSPSSQVTAVPTETPQSDVGELTPTHQSPTSTPTIIPSPTPTPTPLLLELPGAEHDFLYLDRAKGTLNRWHADTGIIEPLIKDNKSPVPTISGKALSYQASTDGQRVLLVIEVQAGEFELVGITLDTKEFFKFYRGETLPNAKISPNGTKIAYLASAKGGPLYIVDWSNRDEIIEVGTCIEEETEINSLPCGGFLWAPDNSTLAWQDARGVWLVGPEQPAQLLAEPLILFENFSGDADLVSNYGLKSWSLSGRYLELGRPYYEGSESVVLDTVTGHINEIPGTFTYIYEAPSLSWLPDDRLLMAQSKVESFDENEQQLAGFVIWKTASSNAYEPLVERSFPLEIDSCIELYAAGQLENGDYFALVDSYTRFDCPDFATGGFFIFDGSSFVQQTIFELEENELGNRIMWSPDQNGLIIEGRDSQIYLSTTNNAMNNLHETLDPDVCCFTWIEN